MPVTLQAAVTIELSTTGDPVTWRASGILLSVDAGSPPDTLIAPLKPRLFRDLPAVVFTNGPRMSRFGAQVQISLSGAFGYPDIAAYWPGDGGDWGPWDAIVDAQMARARSQGRAYAWDIWNEPDDNGALFWKRSDAQYLEMWRHTVQRIRAADASAVIVGPSVTGNDLPFLSGFLLDAKANNVLPDILSLHAFQGPQATATMLTTVRTFLNNNAIAISRISVNEFIYVTEQFEPGTHIRYIAALERAQVESAASSCWEEPGPVSNCFNNSLDGLLTTDTKQPRATWWARKAYGDLSGKILSLTPSPEVDGVASMDPTQATVRVVLGKVGGSSGNEDVLFTRLERAPFLAVNGQVRVIAERIPYSGASALTAPTRTIDQTFTITDNQLRVTLPTFAPTDAYSVQILPPPTSSLANIRIYPNPMRPAKGHTRMTFSHVPAATRIRIFTLAGEKVKDLSANADGTASWDGTNDAGRRVASGVYFALIEGAGDKKRFKIAIQR